MQRKKPGLVPGFLRWPFTWQRLSDPMVPPTLGYSGKAQGIAMLRAVIGMTLLFAASAVQAQTGNCSALASKPMMPMQATVLAPIAPELTAPRHQLGAPTGVLSQALDEALSVDQVLLRIRIEGCQIAKAMPVTTPGMPSSTGPAAYKPLTEFDNTPWRFDMNQNGKRMTADEFSAWMKSKGVRVAKGAPPVAVPATAVPTVPAEPAADAGQGN